jgi:outer membrane protein TolC
MNKNASGLCICSTAVIAVIGLASCNAPKVERTAEVRRFQEAMQERADALKMVPQGVLSVETCADIAIRNNLSLAVQTLALKLSDDQVRLAFSSGLPHFSGAYSYSDRNNSPDVRLTMPAIGTTSATTSTFSMADRVQQAGIISATIPVLDYGISYYAWQNAKDQKAQQTLLLVRAAQQLKRDVRIAYAHHAGAIRQVKLSQVNAMAADRILQVGETMARESLATRAEVAILKATQAQTQVDLAAAQRKVEETRLDLMQLMSLPPDRAVAIDDKLPDLPVPPTKEQLSELEEHALLVRPELQVQDLQRHISANTARQEFAAFFPRIDANGSFNWSNSSSLVNPMFLAYGFQISSALLNGGSQIWQYSMAEKTLSVEEERTLLLSLGVMYDVNLRALRLQRDRETIKALQAQEDARQKAFDEILSLYKAGLETEAGTAKALADLSMQSFNVDKAQTDYLATWYEFQDATLADVPVAATTQPSATQPGAAQPSTMPSTATQPVAAPGLEKGNNP